MAEPFLVNVLKTLRESCVKEKVCSSYSPFRPHPWFFDHQWIYANQYRHLYPPPFPHPNQCCSFNPDTPKQDANYDPTLNRGGEIDSFVKVMVCRLSVPTHLKIMIVVHSLTIFVLAFNLNFYTTEIFVFYCYNRNAQNYKTIGLILVYGIQT